MEHALSSADVARLAGVQRPVVSMWRRRYRSGSHPFPTSRGRLHGADRFDRSEILGWLRDTGRPVVSDDLADLPRLTAFDPEALGLSSLTPLAPGESATERAAVAVANALALATHAGVQLLSDLSTEDLFDAANEIDARRGHFTDDILTSAEWPRIAAYAEGLADACYSYGAAMEWLLNQPGALPSEWATYRLDPRLADLVALMAASLADEVDSENRVFAEIGRGGSDLAHSLWSGPEADTDAVFHLDDTRTSSADLGHLRAAAHGRRVRPLRFDGLEPVLPSTPLVAVASLPSPDNPRLSELDVLLRVEAIETALPDDGRAVVVGPAAALCDVPRDRDAARVQDRLLRRGRLRVALRLPAALMPSRPREQLGLWVLGRVEEHEALRHGTIATACLDAAALVADRQALIDDLRVASDASVLAPRRLAVLRLPPVAKILSGREPLTPRRPSPVGPNPSGSAVGESLDLAQLSHRLDDLAEGITGQRMSALPIDTPAVTRDEPSTIGALARRRELRVVSGVSAEVDHDPHGAVPVVGVHTIAGAVAEDRRTSIPALLAAGLTHRLTQPGDVIFALRPRPYAVIDRSGGRLVVAPARILRITADSGSLLPAALEFAVNNRALGDTDWKEWSVYLVAPSQRESVVKGLAALDDLTDQAQRLLDTVTALRRDALLGAAFQQFVLTPTPSNEETSPHAP